jgi:tetratricopeptide (TPR) repeat protein
MKKIVVFTLTVGLTSLSFAAAPGTTAANFLKMGTGARGSAMGEAQSAVVEDVTSSYWNPAGLAHLRYQELSLMHYDLVQSIRYQQASYAHPTPSKGTFGFGINLFDFGSIQGYDNGGLPTGDVDARHLLITGSWAKKPFINSPLAVGANFKYLQSELAGFKANVPMLDLGAQVPIEAGRLRGLKLAAAIRNLGPDVKYDQEGSPLPQQFVLGAGFLALGGNLALALDAVQTKGSDAYIASGLEYRLFDILRIRVGYNGLSEFVGDGITYGMGLRFTQWNIDYAYVPFGDLGNTSRISVGLRFGRALQMQHADEQVDSSFKRAQQLLALGKGVQAYSELNDLLLIAPWHKPSVELKAKIEKQFEEMSVSRNQAKMEAEIADTFTLAKSAFDRDELVPAKKGFETILLLQPEHVGAKVYLERIQNRYTSLAYESFKLGMDYFAAGDYERAKLAFEKTLTIDENHADARAQLEKTKELLADATKRQQEMELLRDAAQAYKDGLTAYQKNDYEKALEKFGEVKLLAPEYEEVNRYLDLTKTTYGTVLFEQSKVHIDNGQLADGVEKLKKASQLIPGDAKIKSALDLAERDLIIKNSQESQKVYKEGLELYLGGQTEKAVQKWKRALELDSTNDEALKAISKYEEQKKYEKP